MLLRKLLPVLVLFLVCSAGAQSVKNQPQPTSRLIKTANSLLEAQQYDAAEEYFNKALQNAIVAKNSYHQAQTYEGLGNLYNKTSQQSRAVEAYQKSIKLYKALGMTVIADVVSSLLKGVQGIGDLYAGVEIGARGIKLSVIEVKLGKNGANEYLLKMDTSINTDAAALSYQSEKETFDAITFFYNMIRKKYQIPSSSIHIVISSGLKQELDKYNKVEYFAQVVRPKDLDPKIRIRYITVEEESELSFKGIVPASNRLSANQLDIGSGNTKGGYISNSRSFTPVTFPLGTRSFQRLVESHMTGSGNVEDYRMAAEKLIADSLGRVMVYQLMDKRDFKSKDIYISGGIVWAVASLMHPQQIRENYVELSRQDFADFRNLIYSKYDSLINPNLQKLLSTEDAKASLANIKRVVNTYDQKAMVSGAIWLDELIDQVNSVNPSKKFIFHRYAYVGWISGYIMDKISKQYTDLAMN
ncbi:MAG: tetratricopeptide repeat protein [Chitinophagaceae bacterium]|nr:tetratricopeptide repeat protein [Chitinophagaceae bacterium]